MTETSPHETIMAIDTGGSGSLHKGRMNRDDVTTLFLKQVPPGGNASIPMVWLLRIAHHQGEHILFRKRQEGEITLST